MMSASYQLGYRIALLCAGAGALYIADFGGWKAAYTTMAALMAVGITASLLAPHPPQTEQANPRESILKLYAEPVADLIRRNGAMIVPILVLVAIYRVPDFVSGVMANPLYIDLGFSKSAIATVTKIYGVWIGIAGVFAGGVAVLRLGLMPALLIGAIAASASHLTFAWLALAGARLDLLTLAIGIESFASGFAGTALIAFMSSLTSPAFAAAQYALLSSLYALPGKLVGGLSGLMVDTFGYPVFFVITSAIGIPGALLCLYVWRGALAGRPETEVPLPARGGGG
jgi:PAT family beta-lactamase induction signal transducer AmpG